MYALGKFYTVEWERRIFKKIGDYLKQHDITIADCFDLIDNDSTIWEQEPLSNLAKKGELMAYEHTGFWQTMDTLRDKRYLEELWESDRAPWKQWSNQH